MKKDTNTKNNLGFTLIELLVVVAIISLLSAITLGTVQTARIRAEDARIVQQVTAFQNAVALFVTSEGRYPIPNPSDPTDFSCIKKPGSDCVWNNTNFQAPDYSGVSGSDFAFWNSLEKDNLLGNVLYAGTISDYINYEQISMPVVEVGGRSYGGGIMYECNDAACSSADVFYATNNPVRKGSKYAGYNNLYTQDAADPGSGYGGAY
jgi:prepilin-type N-terminal cleavage/methylation domain-containing protein